MPISKSKIAVGCATTEKGHGGISLVSRLMLKSLSLNCEKINCLSYLEVKSRNEFGISIHGAANNKLSFLVQMQLMSLGSNFVFFDSAGIARSRIRIPLFKSPYAVWIHGIEVWENLKPQAYHALKEATCIISNSHYTLDRFQKLHGKFYQARVCGLATEEDERPLFKLNKQSQNILILARIDKSENYKGHVELINSMDIICKDIPTAKLIIAGSGNGVASLKELAARSQFSNNIEFRGFVPQQSIPDLMNEADIFAMPSRGEGFGLVYAEAMRNGLPVIASIHDAGQEVNFDGKTGLNVNLDDKYDLPKKIIYLLNNREIHNEMKKSAQEYWSEHYTFMSFHRRFTKIVEEFIE